MRKAMYDPSPKQSNPLLENNLEKSYQYSVMDKVNQVILPISLHTPLCKSVLNDKEL